MSVIKIDLTPAEMYMAASIGVARHIAACVKHSANAHGADNEHGWQYHIEGACGELAVAKALDIAWSPTINTYKSAGDVGLLEVRTRSRHDYELVVRENDKDATFILVTGVAPHLIVRGWINAKDARMPEWFVSHANRPPQFYVPHAALFDLETLPREWSHSDG